MSRVPVCHPPLLLKHVALSHKPIPNQWKTANNKYCGHKLPRKEISAIVTSSYKCIPKSCTCSCQKIKLSQFVAALKSLHLNTAFFSSKEKNLVWNQLFCELPWADRLYQRKLQRLHKHICNFLRAKPTHSSSSIESAALSPVLPSWCLDTTTLWAWRLEVGKNMQVTLLEFCTHPG